jgi:hypothetical protein
LRACRKRLDRLKSSTVARADARALAQIDSGDRIYFETIRSGGNSARPPVGSSCRLQAAAGK